MPDWFVETWLTPGYSWKSFINGALLVGTLELGKWLGRRQARRDA